MADEIAIQVDDVSFSYPDGHDVLKNISCTIFRGEKVALIGPNGAGKSTFMSLLNGVEMPSSGKVIVGGLDVERENLIKVRRKIGIVFQDPDDQLFCPTVFDDVAFGPLNLGLSPHEINARVHDALALVGLTGFESRSSFHLSFGERKRLALATVLSYQPDMLVFDEPSTNMDPLNRRRLINWLQESEKTILLCTHDLEVCNRCIMLVGGKIVADGPARDILYDRKFLESNNLELPLALMTHELLHEKLRSGQMDAEHRRIIETFLHAHRHAHGPDQHEHFHLHVHPHGHDHLHDHSHDEHAHVYGDNKERTSGGDLMTGRNHLDANSGEVSPRFRPYKGENTLIYTKRAKSH